MTEGDAMSDTQRDGATWRVRGDPLAPSTGRGPLDGLRVAVKDLYAVAGQRIGAGSPEWLQEAGVEAEDAEAVARLRAGGAAIAGIALTDEFAFSMSGTNAHYGTPPNPAAPGCTPGGSSSGPAAAVAAGQAEIGLGTDTGGSIRVPASYTGLWGIRTTHGAVSRAGLLPLADSFDTVGWLARDGETMARVAATLAAPETTACGPATPLPGAERWCEPEVRAAYLAVLGTLRAAGLAASADDTAPAPAYPEFRDTFRTIQGAEAWAADGAWIDAHPGALGADVAGRFAAGRRTTPERLAAARERRAALVAAFDEQWGTQIVLLPAAPSTAIPLDADGTEVERIRAATLALTSICGVTGRPGAVIPVLRTVSGLPAGLCLVGPRGSDRALIELGRTFAAAVSSSRA
jgi:Asp-tRNA(Asn)/Glu-tRNA(Gln) amidotransferase A subunit family amidase